VVVDLLPGLLLNVSGLIQERHLTAHPVGDGKVDLFAWGQRNGIEQVAQRCATWVPCNLVFKDCSFYNLSFIWAVQHLGLTNVSQDMESLKSPDIHGCRHQLAA